VTPVTALSVLKWLSPLSSSGRGKSRLFDQTSFVNLMIFQVVGDAAGVNNSMSCEVQPLKLIDRESNFRLSLQNENFSDLQA
jgi:hypothetical protein